MHNKHCYCVNCGKSYPYDEKDENQQKLANLKMLKHDLSECEKSVLIKIAELSDWFIEVVQLKANCPELPELRKITEFAYFLLNKMLENRKIIAEEINLEIKKQEQKI